MVLLMVRPISSIADFRVDLSGVSCFVIVNYFSGIILPPGEFSITATVSDSIGTRITATIADCEIEFTDSQDLCNNEELLLSNIIDSYVEENPYISKNTMYLYILQSTQAVLLSMDNEILSRDNCSFIIFEDILHVLNDYFASNATNLCQTEYVLVCSLCQ